MSRMLDALKNLSARSEEGSPAVDSGAPAAGPATARANTPPSTDAPRPSDAASSAPPGPADHAARMKDLLVRHLSSPAPTEIYRGESFYHRDDAGPAEAAASGMTIPIGSLARDPQRDANSAAASFPTGEPHSPWDVPDSGESVELTFASSEPSSPSTSAEDSIGAVSDLLSSIDQAAEPAEEVALSFSGPAGETIADRHDLDDAEPEPAVSEQVLEFSDPAPLGDAQPPMPAPIVVSQPLIVDPILSQPSQPLAAEIETSPETQLTFFEAAPGPQVASGDLEPASTTAASPLDHLADARPLATYHPQEEAPPPPAVALPARTICRGKTRLEQRVLDNLSHPSRSLPFRELADRLQQDLRLLAGRCLLFTGIGSASHADDALPHVAALLAEDDAEVLLVDADFARAGLSVGFGALKESGLGELTDSGIRTSELALPTLLPNVSLLPAGRKTLSGALGTVDQLAQLLAALEQRFSLVLIDGGPHTGSLTPALGRLCDATYFVVRLGATDSRAATAALKTFRASGARVMGCVATCSPIAAAS